MPEKRAPWVVLVFAILALWQAPRLIPLADEEGTETGTVKDAAAGERPAWKEPLRLYQEFFGLGTPSKPEPKKPSPSDLVTEIWRFVHGLPPSESQTDAGQTSTFALLKERFEKTPRFSAEFTIVLVPDPLDSHLAYEFDQALEAIQMAYANAGYLLDRQTMPWFGEGAARRSFRTAPGLVLFRKELVAEPPPAGGGPPSPPGMRLASVFVVGESPKQGIQKEAFWAALHLIRRLQEAQQPKEEKQPEREAKTTQEEKTKTYDFLIVGPSLSGSVFSLKQALSEWQAKGCIDSDLCPGRFRFVTGTATAPALDQHFEELELHWKVKPGVSLQRTVARDDNLWSDASKRLEELGWDLNRLALLSEADTAYGQQEAKTNYPIEVRFPSGLASIRSAWEADEQKRPAVSPLPIPFPRTALELVLSGASQPVDVVPQASDLNLSTSDLTLSNLLTALRRDGVRYIGLRASDTRDRIFLAKHIRRVAPGTVLFTYGNSLLYSHPKSGGYLQGTLVLTSFPLALEDESWKGVYSAPRKARRYRRQFGSAFQQGVYLATHQVLQDKVLQSVLHETTYRTLVKETRERKFPAWLAVVGGDSLWPLMRLDAEPGIDFAPQDQRNDLSLLALMMLLFVCVSWLDRLRRPPHGLGEAWPDVPLAHRLVVLGAALIVIMSAALGLVATLPFWNSAPSAWGRALGAHRFASQLFLGAIVLTFGLTLWRACTATRPNAALAGRVQVRKRAPWSPAVGNHLPLGDAARFLAGSDPLDRLQSALWTARKFITRLGVKLRSRHVTRRGWPASAFLLGLLALPLLAASLHHLWMPGGAELFDARARRFSSGLSPLPPFLLLGLGLLLWLFLELSRGRLLELHGVHWPLSRQFREASMTGASRIASDLSHVMRQSLLALQRDGRTVRHPLRPIRSRRFWFLLLLVLLPPFLRLWNVLQPICEPRMAGWLFLGAVVACVIAGAASFRQFFASWAVLERLLRRLELTWLKAAFERVAPKVEWSPMRSFGWRVPSLQIPVLSRAKLKEIPAQRRRTIESLENEIDEQLRALFKAETSGAMATEHQARRNLNLLMLRASRGLSEQQLTPAVQDFLAVRVVAYLRPVFVHMRHCLLQAMASFLLALAAASFYAFQPQWFVQMALWAGIVVGVVLTFWTFVQMDRHPVLSAIGGTRPGEITFDRHFFTNLLTYAIVPVVGALVVYFPPFGRVLLSLFGPLTRVAGGG